MTILFTKVNKMIEIPVYLFLICILIFPVYLAFDRMWATFDNWLKEKTIQQDKQNKIGF